jgi:hypothetical protein
MPYPRAYATRYPGGTELSGYDPLLIDSIKRLPVHARRYYPERKAWFIEAPYDEAALRSFRARFPDAPVLERTRQRQAPPPPPRRKLVEPRHYEVLYLVEGAPVEVAEVVYRFLAKKHHPDRLPAGEQHRATATMAALNVAIEAIRTKGAA